MELIYKLILCHFVGDYVLQNDFIAKTKGTNWWHLIAHCFLYSLPFYLAFGFDWRLCVILVSHLIIDPLKARWNKINYYQDQLFHVAVMILCYVLLH